MKISRNDLQKYFENQLPSTSAIADAFTFHCFEIEEVDGDTLDIKVLTNRAADCNSEAGIAAELSAILDMPLKNILSDGFSEKTVDVSLTRINAILGADFSEADVEEVFRRLRFHVEKHGDTYRVAAPLSRIDVELPEDVAEEVGRILGYDRIPETELPSISSAPDQARYRGIERIKDFLVERGFIEISTQSFAKKGEIILANPLDKTSPALRMNLEKGIKIAGMGAKQYAPLVLGPHGEPALFEVGTAFIKVGEKLYLALSKPTPELNNLLGIESISRGEIIHYDLSEVALENLGRDYMPIRYELSAYKPFSVYPFITRDIALWVPGGTDISSIESVIRENAGELLVRLDQFDHFEKEGRVSYAFRLIFQAMDRTLTDDEVGGIMEKITGVLSAKDYEVR